MPGRLKIDENGKLVYDGPMKISTMPNLYAKDENGNFVQISTEINPDNGTLIDNGTLTTNKNPKFVSEGIIENDAISLPTVDENGNIVYKKGEGKFSTMPSHFKIDENGKLVYEGGEGKFSTMPSHFKIDENGKLVYDGPKEFDTLDSTVSDVGESNNI